MDADIERTNDVKITEDLSFRDMMLSPQVLTGLTKFNFVKPSPIQLRAIPIGRCGLDLIIQSKSGTGKTLVYCTIILERYNPNIKAPQSLVVVPTREIALQVEAYLNNIGCNCSGFNVTCVIGGRDITDDRKRINKCKAIVGTPGRLLHLIKNKFICLQNIEILVLDEADKLVTEDFYKDINILLDALDNNRQIIATSATYANGLDKQIVSFMQNPIAVSTARETPILVGIKQFKLNVEQFSIPNSVTHSNASIQAMWRKVSAVDYILSTTSFKQCILFSNSQLRAKSFANYLSQNKWTVELVLGSHDQSTRTATLQKFRQYKSRILITSDLLARGVDIENVDLVINLDVPSDSSTYLHRIGRCGRFGRKGLAITLIGDVIEMEKFQTLLAIIGGSKINVASFSTNLNGDTKFDAWNTENPGDNSDSCEFGLFNSNGMPNTMERNVINNDSHKQECQSQNKGESLEQTNLKLLEVARLLVDNKPKNSAVENVDIDLFASFQLSNNVADPNIQPNNIISEDSFEEFTQDGEIIHEKKVFFQHGIKVVDQISEDLRVDFGNRIAHNRNIGFSTEEMFDNVKEIQDTSANSQDQTQKLADSSIDLTTPNELWAKTYWQQLSDINQYVNTFSHLFT